MSELRNKGWWCQKEDLSLGATPIGRALCSGVACLGLSGPQIDTVRSPPELLQSSHGNTGPAVCVAVQLHRRLLVAPLEQQWLRMDWLEFIQREAVVRDNEGNGGWAHCVGTLCTTWRAWLAATVGVAPAFHREMLQVVRRVDPEPKKTVLPSH